MLKEERGSVVVESIFSMMLISFLALGAIQVALSLYARNVLVAATHEGARAAAEFDRDLVDPVVVAGSTIEGSAGGLIHDLDVSVSTTPLGTREVIVVTSKGKIRPLGPVPFSMTFGASATVSRETSIP